MTPQEHHLWQTAPQVQAICQDFFARSGVSCFGLTCLYANGSRAILTTHPEGMLDTIKREYFHKLYATGIRANRYSSFTQEIIEDVFVPKALRDILAAQVQIEREQYRMDFKCHIKEPGDACNYLAIFLCDKNRHDFPRYYYEHFYEMVAFVRQFILRAANLITQAEQHPFITVYQPNKAAIDLTTKERLICQQLCLGFKAKEIAQQLFLSPRTVESYISELKYKLDCRNVTQLAALYTERHLGDIPLDNLE